MNKLEKLNIEKLSQSVKDETEQYVPGLKRLVAANSMSTRILVTELNAAIDHITALESEVDRLKGHTHHAIHLTDNPRITQRYPTTPPTMETDKQ
jgi:hypothetical protein